MTTTPWASARLKPPLFWCLNRIGARRSERTAIILAYHEIASPGSLREQFSWIADGGWRVVSISDLCGWMLSGQSFPPRALSLTFDDGYLSQFECAAPLLKEFDFPGAFFVLASRGEGRSYWEGEATTLPSLPLMGLSQVRELVEAGFEVGSHGLTHRQLTRLSPSARRSEVFDGKSRLEDELGRKIDYFAYPYGDLDAEVISLVRDAGFRAAVSTIRGSVSTSDDVFCLKRMTVLGSPRLEEFRAYLSGMMASYLNFRDRVRNAWGI